LGDREVAGLPEREHFAQAKGVQTHCQTQRAVLPGSIAKRALGWSTANEPRGWSTGQKRALRSINTILQNPAALKT
jgi:hypothetical protein